MSLEVIKLGSDSCCAFCHLDEHTRSQNANAGSGASTKPDRARCTSIRWQNLGAVAQHALRLSSQKLCNLPTERCHVLALHEVFLGLLTSATVWANAIHLKDGSSTMFAHDTGLHSLIPAKGIDSGSWTHVAGRFQASLGRENGDRQLSVRTWVKWRWGVSNSGCAHGKCAVHIGRQGLQEGGHIPMLLVLECGGAQIVVPSNHQGSLTRWLSPRQIAR